MELFNGDVGYTKQVDVAPRHPSKPPEVSIYRLFIDLLGPPTKIHVSDNQTVNEGDKVTLNCTADGNPAPNITWTRLSSDNRITFPINVSRHDEGGYRCSVDNGIATEIRDVFITVQCE